MEYNHPREVYSNQDKECLFNETVPSADCKISV